MTVTTRRVTAVIAADNTKRVLTSGSVAASGLGGNTWGRTWGRTWGNTWSNFGSAATAAPIENSTKRVISTAAGGSQIRVPTTGSVPGGTTVSTWGRTWGNTWGHTWGGGAGAAIPASPDPNNTERVDFTLNFAVLLLEDTGFFLLEDGGYLVLESMLDEGHLTKRVPI